MTSRIDRLIVKPMTIKIGDMDVDIKPLRLKDLTLLTRLSIKGPDQQEALKELAFITLREAFPEATDEEIGDVGFSHFETIMDAILKVNNLGSLADAKVKKKE